VKHADILAPIEARKELTMPVIEPVSDEQASPEAKAILGNLAAKMKTVPNIFRTMAYAPEVLDATLRFSASVQKQLDPKLRELAYLKTSEVNECHYWTHYHKILGQRAGLSKDQVEQLDDYMESDAYSDLEKTVITFAQQVATNAKADDAVMAKLVESLSPEELVKLAATVAQATWTNQFNNTFGVELP
jgi:AhpD family alkylhydroperoxidase